MSRHASDRATWNLFQRSSQGRKQGRSRRSRLTVEALEARRLLAIFVEGLPTWDDLGSRPMINAGSVSDPQNPASGAVEAIAVDPNNRAHMFVAAVNGGIWRTTNGDRPFNGVDDDMVNGTDDPLEQPDWTPLTDQYRTLSISEIRFSPLDATGNTVFAGTGSTSSLGNAGGIAIGIMRTTDGGDTWSVFPLNGGGSQPTVRAIVPTTLDADLIAPGVQQVVLVGAVGSTGLYRSTDGGQTYTGISGPEGLPNGTVSEIIADPNNASQFFAGVIGQGVYRSIDGGATWTAANTGLTGLGSSTTIQLSAHPGGGTTVLHALVSGPSPAAFTSNNSGASWTPLAALPATFTSTNNGLYPSYASDQLTTDPTNSAIVYVAKGYGGSPFILRYDPAGGGSWVQIQSVGAVNNTRPHVDSRDLQFAGSNVLIHANDGGIYFLVDPQDPSGNEWTSLHGRGASGLGVTEYHNVAWDSTFDVATGGAQDNGTSVQNATGDLLWSLYSGNDGGDVQVDTVNAGAGRVFRYASSQNFGWLQRFTFDSATNQPDPAVDLFPGGGLTNFTAPFVPQYELNAVTRASLVTGGSGTSPVYELTNAATATGTGDANWQAVPVGAGFAAVNGGAIAYGGRKNGVDLPDILVVGSGTRVYVRTVAGGTLTATTAIPGAGTIQDIELDPEDWQHFFVADGAAVFETTNGGTSWTPLTRNLPLVNARLQSIEFVPTDLGGVVLVGGDLGVSRLPLYPADAQWTRFGAALPNAPVFDLDYNATDDLLVAGMFGRGASLVDDASIVAQLGAVLTVCGDSDHVNQDDVIRLVRDQLNPLILNVFVNNPGPVATYSLPLGLLAQINIFGVGGNDQLVVDSSNGLIRVPDGIRYDGDGWCGELGEGGGFIVGDDRGFDSLILTGTTTQTSSSLGIGQLPGSGRSTIAGTENGITANQVVWFEELEPVIDSVPTATFTISGIPGLATLLDAANTVGYTDGVLLAGAGRVTVDNFEPVEFANKTTVTVSLGEGNDSFFANSAVAPTGLATLTVNGDNGHDTLTFARVPLVGGTFVSVVATGGFGNDTIDASAVDVNTPFSLFGNEGHDVLVGGRGSDQFDGGSGDDTLIGGDPAIVALLGNNTYTGGSGFDTLVVRGTSANDVIDVAQTAPGSITSKLNGNSSTETISTIEQVQVTAGTGNDLVRIKIADNLAAQAVQRYYVQGDGPNASDRLIVTDEGIGDLVLVRQAPDERSGRVSIAPGAAAPLPEVVYDGIERLDITPVNSITGGSGAAGDGRIVVFQADPFELNDNRLIATDFEDIATIHRDPTIDPGVNPSAFGAMDGVPGDEDWYEFRATKTGTFRFDVYFKELATLPSGRPGLPQNGNLDTSVYGAAGQLIVIGTPVAGAGEQATISVQAGLTYYLRVQGAASANGVASGINTYDVRLSEVDLVGPQVVDPDGSGPLHAVHITNDPATPAVDESLFDLFNPKPSLGPTPLVKSITINLRDIETRDLIGRAPGDIYGALDLLVASQPGHYQVRGDQVGLVGIQQVLVTSSLVTTLGTVNDGAPTANQFIGDAGLSTVDGFYNGQILQFTSGPLTGQARVVTAYVGATRTLTLASGFSAAPANGNAFSILPVATAKIELRFFTPLPDDRYTVTVLDSVLDPAGNQFDGESNAAEPLENPTFPSGDGIAGGDFVARFTVDSRAELGAYSSGSVYVDTNGNNLFDPTNLDATNRDITYVLGFTSDNLFAGNFALGGGASADGFDKLAAYGKVGTTYRWLIDTDNNGVADLNVVQPLPAGVTSVNGMPAAGNFDGNAANGDEVVLKVGNIWLLDKDHNYKVETKLPGTNMVGLPIVGDFDGDGFDDLGAWADDRFTFDLSEADGVIDGSWDVSFTFGFAGVRERPYAADFDGDKITDFGLWVPDRSGAAPSESAEWYTFVSDGRSLPQRLLEDNGAIRFKPTPFGADRFAQFGDEFGLPVPGNFDPPLTQLVPPGSSTNIQNNLDVDNDGLVAPLDALLVINQLNSGGSSLAASPYSRAPWVDVDGDGVCAPRDALLIINELNALAMGGEGEGAAAAEDTVFLVGANVETPASPVAQAAPWTGANIMSSKDSGDSAQLADRYFRDLEDDSADLDELFAALASDAP